jgi:hypothetical protein
MSKNGSKSSSTSSKSTKQTAGKSIKQIHHSVDGKKITPPAIPTKKK